MKVSSTGRYNSINIKDRNIKNKNNTQNFKGAGVDAAFNMLDAGFKLLDKNAMIQVSFVDTVSTNIPRTLVDLKTGLAASLETFRREFSGLFVNCLMPGLVVKGLAGIMPKAKEFEGTDVVGSWANGASIDRLKDVYSKAQMSSSKDKTRAYVEQALGSLEGLDGKNWVKFADKAVMPEYSQAVDAVTEAISKTGKERKNLLKQAQAKLVGVTKAENILKFNGAPQANLEETLRDVADLGSKFNVVKSKTLKSLGDKADDVISPETASKVVNSVEKYGDKLQIEYVVVNPTIGSHCGPDTIGVCFYAKHK